MARRYEAASHEHPSSFLEEASEASRVMIPSPLNPPRLPSSLNRGLRRRLLFRAGSAFLVALSLLHFGVADLVPMEEAEAPSPPDESAKTVRLLSVGNSFSRNATRYLEDLATAAGHRLVHRPVIVGGASLELHASKALAALADPEDPEGRYADGASLPELLRSEAWDHVTIQQASIRSHDPGTFRPWAIHLRDLMAEHAPGAELLVHQTWAYRRDDPRFQKPDPDPGEPRTQEEMFRGLEAAYRGIAEELGARLIPSGAAFFLADSDPEHGYRTDGAFDFDTAMPPALPDQSRSLHVGWRWQRSGESPPRLRIDGRHAGLEGEYLAACVWFEILFGETAVGNPFVPSGIAPDRASWLQGVASLAVAQEPY